MKRIEPNAQLKQKLEIDIVSYRIQNSDSFNVNILLKIPLKSLVFKKQNNEFIGNIRYTFTTKNHETKAVVNRVTKNRSISVSFYEDTRAVGRFFQIETQITLLAGEYDLLSIIEDIDSHNIFKNTSKMNVGDMEMIGKLTAFYYEGEEKYYIITNYFKIIHLKFEPDCIYIFLYNFTNIILFFSFIIKCPKFADHFHITHIHF